MNRTPDSLKGIFGRLRGATGRDFAWGFASQGASSATNLGLSILAGRLLGPTALGSIFVGLSYYLLAMGFQRSLISDPLRVGTSSLDENARRAATDHAFTLVLLGSIAATVLLIALSVALPGDVGHGLILFVPWLVPALVQDFWRSVLFRDRRGAAGALNDALWLAGMAVTLPLVLVVRTEWVVVANWGVGALVAAITGFLQCRVRWVDIKSSVRWWKARAWSLGRWLAAESAVYAVGSQLLVFTLAGILGTRDLGGLRAVQTMFGPLSLLAPALALPGLPALARASTVSAARAMHLALLVSGLALLLAGAYLAVAAALSGHLLEWVFGTSFRGFEELIIPVGVGQIFAAAAMGFALLLMAQARGKALLVARVVGSVSSLVLAIVLAGTKGVAGAAWGMAAAGGLASLVLVAYSIRGWARASSIGEEGSERTASRGSG